MVIYRRGGATIDVPDPTMAYMNRPGIVQTSAHNRRRSALSGLDAFVGEEEPWEPIVSSTQFWVEFQDLLDRLSQAMLLRHAAPDAYRAWPVGLMTNWGLDEVITNFMKAAGVGPGLPRGMTLEESVAHYIRVFHEREPKPGEAAEFIKLRTRQEVPITSSMLSPPPITIFPTNPLLVFDIANQALFGNPKFQTLRRAFNSLGYHRRPDYLSRILGGISLFLKFYGPMTLGIGFLAGAAGAAIPSLVSTSLKVASLGTSLTQAGLRATADAPAASLVASEIPNQELVQPAAVRPSIDPMPALPELPNQELVEPSAVSTQPSQWLLQPALESSLFGGLPLWAWAAGGGLLVALLMSD